MRFTRDFDSNERQTSRYDFELLGKSKGKKSDPEGSAPRDQPTVPSEDETKESDPSPLEADPSPVKADQDTKTHDGGQGGRGPKKPHRHGNHIQLEIDVMSRPAPRDQPRVPRGDASIPPLAYDGAQDDGLSPAQRLQRQFERAEIERRGSAAAAASEPPPTPSAPDFAAEDFPDLGLAGPETRRQRDAVSAGLDLVPYCTTRAKLNREEVLNLSDLAGGLNDLVILAVGGYVNEEGTDVLDGALGKEVADGIRAFWAEEFLIEL